MNKARSTGIALLLTTLAASAQVVITNYNLTYTEDFNTLASSGTSSVLPTGWFLSETGTAANTTYNSGTGSLNTGDTYSFGSSSSTERALGTLLSGSLSSTIGAAFQNNGGETILSISIAYQGEQWRLGFAGRVDRLDFQYSLDATSLSTGTWTDFDALDFTAPITAGSPGALDGNAPGNFAIFSSTNIPSLNVAPGSTFWIRWVDFNATNADDGLAIDNISIVVPEPTAGLALTGGAAMFLGLCRRRK
jgi:hypothetical protein